MPHDPDGPHILPVTTSWSKFGMQTDGPALLLCTFLCNTPVQVPTTTMWRKTPPAASPAPTAPPLTRWAQTASLTANVRDFLPISMFVLHMNQSMVGLYCSGPPKVTTMSGHIFQKAVLVWFAQLCHFCCGMPVFFTHVQRCSTSSVQRRYCGFLIFLATCPRCYWLCTTLQCVVQALGAPQAATPAAPSVAVLVYWLPMVLQGVLLAARACLVKMGDKPSASPSPGGWHAAG